MLDAVQLLAGIDAALADRTRAIPPDVMRAALALARDALTASDGATPTVAPADARLSKREYQAKWVREKRARRGVEKGQSAPDRGVDAAGGGAAFGLSGGAAAEAALDGLADAVADGLAAAPEPAAPQAADDIAALRRRVTARKEALGLTWKQAAFEMAVPLGSLSGWISGLNNRTAMGAARRWLTSPTAGQGAPAAPPPAAAALDGKTRAAVRARMQREDLNRRAAATALAVTSGALDRWLSGGISGPVEAAAVAWLATPPAAEPPCVDPAEPPCVDHEAPHPAEGRAQFAPNLPPPIDATGLEAVPASLEDAQDWLYAELLRRRVSAADAEVKLLHMTPAQVLAECNARRIAHGLSPYAVLERAA